MQNINLIPNEFTLADYGIFLKKQLKIELNCMHMGTIESFNSTEQTAQVSINYTQTFLQQNPGGSTAVNPVPYPLLLQCPVVFLGGGLSNMTFPVTSGDECMVLFNDRDMSSWWGTGGANLAPNTGRLHGFSDAVAIVGIRSFPKSIQDFNSSDVEINYADNSITLGATSSVITVAGNTITLNESKAVVALSTGVTLELDSTGKLKITNLTGELITSIVNLFTTATTATLLGPQPLILSPTDLAILESFEG